MLHNITLKQPSVEPTDKRVLQRQPHQPVPYMAQLLCQVEMPVDPCSAGHPNIDRLQGSQNASVNAFKEQTTRNALPT